MRDEDKTREQLLEELQALRAQVGQVNDHGRHPGPDGPTERPRLPLERLPLAYILLDADDRILDWNPAAEKIFGYPRAEALGRVALDLLVPLPANDHVREVIRRLRAGDMDAHSVNDNRTRDGRLITCAWFNTPLWDAGGRFAGVLALVQDITAQRRAEEKLRESEALFRQLADNIDGYFWLNALDDSRFYYVSPGYEKIKGQSCAGLYQRPQSWTDVIHPEDLAGVLAVVGAPFGQAPRQVEYRIVRPDGAVRWIRDRAFPVRNAAGEVYRVAGIGEDVTERKQAEQEVREYYERVQALSRQLLTVREEERRHLARELHDEIGQILTSLKFALEGALAALPQAAPDKTRALPERLLGEARTLLAEALRRVRELSFDLRPALLDHLGLLPALRGLFERYTARTRVRVNFNQAGLERRFAPEVETTAYRIVQEALTNVARHARVAEAVVRAWVDADTLTIQVEDEGAGFDHAAALAAGRSSGLPGMYERVLLQGGRLVIESTPGEGTQLLAELPLTGGGGRKVREGGRRPGPARA
jgi:PAS domain S-box-containing protein